MAGVLLMVTLQACLASPGPGDTSGTAGPPVRINELMASNYATVQDPAGAWPDWVELYNPAAAPVSLEGWSITDRLDDPRRHVISDLWIDPGEHLVLWADAGPELGPDHLGFALDAEGEALGLYDPEARPVDGLTFGKQVRDLSLGRSPDGDGSWTILRPPTPAAPNGA